MPGGRAVAGHPDDDGGTRLIVDIASPRRLLRPSGRVPRPRGTHPSSEIKVLRLYAEYAATALDIFGVLTDAKRSDATARTLLSFSESLSRVTNLVELVQLLADTVPAVTDCDQSTVYLWDHETRPAGTRGPGPTGTSPADGYLGPIVPVTGSPGRTPPRPIRPCPDARSAGRASGVQRPGRPGTVCPERSGPSRGGSSDAVDHPPRHPDDRADAATEEVMVLDDSTEDPVLRGLLDRSGMAASVVAPLFADGEFLGVVAANFGRRHRSAADVRDADLHERLSGLADQAATALQNLELLEKVSHMAWHDALTGLPNRRLFEDRVEQELVRSRRVGEPVCMFFVDLDHFKSVNDTLGHAAGDDLIQQVSQRLVDTVRAPGHRGPGRRRRVRHPAARSVRPAVHRSAGPALARGA